jgi:CubicO group peptidase (beta-lactamase class C family)
MMSAWLARGLATAGTAALLSMFAAAADAIEATSDKVSAALPKIEAYIEKLVADDAVPGLSVAIVFEDEVVYVKGFGAREMGKAELVDADTVFQLASFSKPISSTVVAAIVSDGSVTWDSRIADIDPTFQLHDAYPSMQVTVRDLFAHRSGLPGDAGNELESLGYDRDEVLHRLRLVPPSSSFRAGYSYSNFGITEGAVAAARTTGKAWEDAAEDLLYKPLGMSSTSSRYADFLKHDNRATLHVRYEDKWQALAKRMPDAQAPAGGVSSNARDLAQWMRLELGGGKFDGEQLIEADAIGQTHLPVIARGSNPITGTPAFYGLGWNVDYGRYGVVWGHAGAFSQGARTVVNLIPDEKLGIIVLSNAFPTGAPEAVADTFFDFVFDGEATRDWLTEWNGLFGSLFGPAIEAAKATFATPPTPPSPALPASAYAGTYANDYIGSAVIAEEAGGLVAKLGPNGEKAFPLKHFDRDLFLYYPYDEMPELPVAVTFETGPDQKATQVNFDDLNNEGLGVLRRASE